MNSVDVRSRSLPTSSNYSGVDRETVKRLAMTDKQDPTHDGTFGYIHILGATMIPTVDLRAPKEVTTLSLKQHQHQLQHLTKTHVHSLCSTLNSKRSSLLTPL